MTVLEVTILSNDYPNGVFMIDASNTATAFAEDFDGNGKYTTQGNISFMREQGSFYAAEVGTRFALKVLDHLAGLFGIVEFFLLVVILCNVAKNKLLVLPQVIH